MKENSLQILFVAVARFCVRADDGVVSRCVRAFRVARRNAQWLSRLFHVRRNPAVCAFCRALDRAVGSCQRVGLACQACRLTITYVCRPLISFSFGHPASVTVSPSFRTHVG